MTVPQEIGWCIFEGYFVGILDVVFEVKPDCYSCQARNSEQGISSMICSNQ